MGGSVTYSKELPDYRDLDNKAGNCNGYKTYIIEKDGGVSIQTQDAEEASDNCNTLRGVFMNVNEAEEFNKKLQETIDKAKMKNINHPQRGREIFN